jgi:hypothetical protein
MLSTTTRKAPARIHARFTDDLLVDAEFRPPSAQQTYTEYNNDKHHSENTYPFHSWLLHVMPM